MARNRANNQQLQAQLDSENSRQQDRIEQIKRYIASGGRGRDPSPEREATSELFEEE